VRKAHPHIRNKSMLCPMPHRRIKLAAFRQRPLAQVPRPRPGLRTSVLSLRSRGRESRLQQRVQHAARACARRRAVFCASTRQESGGKVSNQHFLGPERTIKLADGVRNSANCGGL
jgi:hypothetical protein